MEYFLNLPTELWKKYCIFRTGNAKLPIETDRRYLTFQERTKFVNYVLVMNLYVDITH